MKLKLGDYLYRTTSPAKLFAYKIVALVQRERGKFYEIVCEQCADHERCHVLVNAERDGTFRYVEMLNNEDNQYYWHNDGIYFTKKNEAIKNCYQGAIENARKEIEKHKASIKYEEDRIAVIESHLNQLTIEEKK